MNDYEARKAEKLERRANQAERLASAANHAFKHARSFIEHIPMGQPILVGHHSERGHRRALERHDSWMRKGVALQKASAEAAYRAANPSTAIQTEDPEAIAKLKEELAEKVKIQETMKAANKLVRKHHKDPVAGAKAIAEATGMKEATALKLFTPDCMGAWGFPLYSITNNGANIRRIQGRIDQLTRRAKVVEARIAATGTAEVSRPFQGGRLVESPEENRLLIFFDRIPDKATRQQLKSAAFRWSPNRGAWSAYLGHNSKWQAERILNLTEGA